MEELKKFINPSTKRMNSVSLDEENAEPVSNKNQQNQLLEESEIGSKHCRQPSSAMMFAMKSNGSIDFVESSISEEQPKYTDSSIINLKERDFLAHLFKNILKAS